ALEQRATGGPAVRLPARGGGAAHRLDRRLAPPRRRHPGKTDPLRCPRRQVLTAPGRVVGVAIPMRIAVRGERNMRPLTWRTKTSQTASCPAAPAPRAAPAGRQGP